VAFALIQRDAIVPPLTRTTTNGLVGDCSRIVFKIANCPSHNLRSPRSHASHSEHAWPYPGEVGAPLAAYNPTNAMTTSAASTAFRTEARSGLLHPFVIMSQPGAVTTTFAGGCATIERLGDGLVLNNCISSVIVGQQCKS